MNSGETIANCVTLVEALALHARSRPEATAFGFLRDGLDLADSVTWRELWMLSLRLGADLDRCGLRGRPVLLLCQGGIEFAVAFVACLLTGTVAVPMPVPRKPSQWQRLGAVLATAEIAAILGNEFDRMELHHAEIEACARIEVSLSRLRSGSLMTAPTWALPRPNDLAFLQYTSGSTGTPHGVRVSHANILANQQQIRGAFGTTAESIGVSWLPLFHDMGLIGTLLHPIYVGFTMMLMSPAAFLRHPESWLRAISRFGATVSGAPNFAYQLCVDRIGQGVELDLSTWSTAFCGAERVAASTVDAFCDRFKQNGFRPAAFFPCYGLAEATLFVSGGPMHTGVRKRRIDMNALARGEVIEGKGAATLDLVGCGKAGDIDEVAIVDPDSGTTLESMHVGEIWVRGPSVAGGYVGHAELGHGVFDRVGSDGSHGWLATGDLGFLDPQRDLFVCGRRREMIIVRGRNLFPQDIEHTVCAAASELEPTACAAVAIQTVSGEAVAIVAEWRRGVHARDEAAVVRSVRDAVGADFEIALKDVRLVRPGSLPKTTSGKLQRAAIGADFVLEDKTEIRHGLHPTLPNELALAAAIRIATGSDSLDFSATASANGLDSLGIFRVQSQLLEQSGLELDAVVLLNAESLAVAASLAEPAVRKSGSRMPFPLSSNQVALWLDQQRRPHSAEYVLCVPLQLHESVSTERLREAFLQFLHEHRLLGMNAHATESGVEWRARAFCADAFVEHAIEDPSSEFLRRTMERLATTPLEPERSALFQLHHFAMRGSGDVLVLVAHHLVTDATALRQAVAEIEQRYHGMPIPSAVEYAEFVAWQREWLDSPASDAATAYWRQRLQVMPTSLNWPGQPASIAETGMTSRLLRQLPATLCVSLRRFAQQHDVSPFHVMIAAHLATVARWVGESWLACCVPTLGRTARFERLQGYCVQPALVVLDIGRSHGMAELACEVRDQCLAAIRHPWLAPHRSSALSTPADHAFRLIVDCQPAGLGSMPMECRWQPHCLSMPDAERRPDLALSLRETGDGFSAEFEYRRDCLGAALIDQVVEAWQRLLEEWPGQATRPPLDLVHLPRDAWSVQISGASPRTTTAAYAGWLARIVEHAHGMPDATALVAADSELSYAELIAWAGQVAIRLRELGVGNEDRVAVLIRRSPAMIAALLGVMLAGAAYVPLDAAYPPGRIECICAQVAPSLLLTDEDAIAVHGVMPRLPIAAHPQEGIRTIPVAPSFPAEQLAYIIYTSGSTGLPKGVCIRHGSVDELLAWARITYSASQWSGVAATTSICFDLSIFELFATLYCGGTIHLFPNALAVSEARDDARLHLLNTVPSALRELLAESALPCALEIVNVAGEPLSESLVALFQQNHPQVGLFNLYGPSEDTTYSTVLRLPMAARGKPGIGRVLPGTEAWILDEALRPVPQGVVGELCLAGDGLARGYYAAPAQTAERFVPHPYAMRPGQRLYRTGDLASLNGDGLIDLHGRNDQQVKLRGFRIELGEVTAALEKIAGIEEAAVVLLQGASPAQTRMVAFVTPADVDAVGARRALEDVLPAYMVPQAIRAVTALPLGPTGKIDRSALSALASETSTLTVSEPPCSAMETVVMQIWQELLPEAGFGVHDDFFACGGHSLLLMQMAREIKARSGVQLSMAQLFSTRTIRGIAVLLEHCRVLDQVVAPSGLASTEIASGVLEL